MSEQKRNRGIKVMVKRRIWLEVDGKPEKQDVGTILVLDKEQVKHFGAAVTRDVPDLDDEDQSIS